MQSDSVDSPIEKRSMTSQQFKFMNFFLVDLSRKNKIKTPHVKNVGAC